VVDFSKLLETTGGAVEVAPAQFEDVDIGFGETVRCLKNGLWLLRGGAAPYTVVLSQHQHYSGGTNMAVEVAAPSGETGAALARLLRPALVVIENADLIAFIKEFMRRIAQHHLDAGGDGDVPRKTAEAALHEMLFSGGRLNTRLLGGEAVSE
jgi:hypothetical protein